MNKRLLKPAALALAVVVLAFLPALPQPMVVYYAIWGLMGVLWALGLNFFMGYCGRIHFGVAAYGAIAAYTLAILVGKMHMPFWGGLVISLVVTAVAAYVTGVLFLRLRRLVLGLATLAFGIIMYTSARSGFGDITGGDDGLFIPPLTIFGSTIGEVFYYYVVLVLACLGYLVARAILHSPVGRAMRAIDEDEEAAIAMGVDVNKHVLLATMLTALYSSFAAILFVQWNGWVSPEYFNSERSILVVTGVLVGGIGSPTGTAVGGAILMLLPLVLIPFREYLLLIYGLVLLLVLRFAPGGLAGIGRQMVLRISATREGAGNARETKADDDIKRVDTVEYKEKAIGLEEKPRGGEQ